jgi:hypothetical protein
MSPIISFRDDGPKPPPFSSSPAPASLPPSSADGRPATSFDDLDEDDLPVFSPSPSDGPSASPYPSAKVKPPGDALDVPSSGRRAAKQPRLGARQRSGDYGGLEREDGADDAGLLQYEMDVLDGTAGASSPIDGTAGESVARRRERGEAIISGGRGSGGWLGLRRPSPAGTKEILGIVYEVRRFELTSGGYLRCGRLTVTLASQTAPTLLLTLIVRCCAAST